MYDYSSTLGDGTFKKRNKDPYFKKYEVFLLFPTITVLLGANGYLIGLCFHLGFLPI